jgi:hypothetical protein
MKDDFKEKLGLESLLEKYRKVFRVPENLNFYSEEDYKTAERKFVKYSLYGKAT